MNHTQESLAESILQILSPLCWEWEDAEWLMNSIENGLFSEEKLTELAHLLITATTQVEQNERILHFSQISDFAKSNREKEYLDREQEKRDTEYLINSL